jgi:hypothetical protein
MTNLILHVGHQKTGTSFIQSILAYNTEYLNNYFYYPPHHSFSGASMGHISSGNGSLLLSKDLNINNYEKILFSGEQLFERIRGEFNSELKNICKNNSVKVILYSRNVIDYFFSSWGQAIKRGGHTNDFQSYLLNAINSRHVYSKIIDWINLSVDFGFELIIRNYSNHQENLIDVFMNDVTGIDSISAKLKHPPILKVNRSLSFIELEIQKVFNTFDKKSSRYISDNLVNFLPDVQSAKASCSKEIYKTITEKMNPFLNEINSRINPSESLSIGDIEKYNPDNSTKNQQYTLSKAQIDILSDSLNSEFYKFFNLKDYTNELRDIALKIETKEVLTLNDALILMKIAQSSRPDGKLISRKIAEWENKV